MLTVCTHYSVKAGDHSFTMDIAEKPVGGTNWTVTSWLIHDEWKLHWKNDQNSLVG